MANRRVSSPERRKNPYNQKCFCTDWLTWAIYEVVHRSPIKIKEITYRLNNDHHITMSQSALEGFASPIDSAKHRCMHIRLILPLTEASENTYLIDEFERQLGREIPAKLRAIDHDLEASCHAMLRQANTLSTVSSKVIQQSMSPQALTEIRPVIGDMRRQMDAFDGAAGQVLYGRFGT